MRGRVQCYTWMGLGWSDGMVIIGRRSSKSNFGAENDDYDRKTIKDGVLTTTYKLLTLLCGSLGFGAKKGSGRVELRLLRRKEHRITRICLQESVIVKTAGNDFDIP